ncbi:MAG TPA: deoxyribose-phosphate aldolase [Candidatus Coprenecus stercoravium]|uniref:Deoxyribose-phosphate aldolase n=1 Tax=Candidatus Coprenecus stercoravium TaxID=2840735 RepID=A0A9D2GRR9_9BACT|nr:deoxyribose-phosphate aldolase [Candidatus Coprenecus stercoravium]
MEDVLKACLSMTDLTSLKSTDTPGSIRKLTESVNCFQTLHPGCPYPASICVYPNFARTVKDALTVPGVHVTAVAGCFPASQSFIEVKELECRMAVADGADEVDVVIPLNSFLDSDLNRCSNELRTMKTAVGDAILKVILETGVLPDEGCIREASFLAMESGADFIKTSTGKLEPAATPEAARVMCSCISEYYKKTGRKVGLKPAGGISTAGDAVTYYEIVAETLGEEWLTPRLLRFGASRLVDSIINQLSITH